MPTKKERVLIELISKLTVPETIEPPVFVVYQANLGSRDMGLHLDPAHAEQTVLNFNPNAKRTKDFTSNPNPPEGEYSVIGRAVRCNPKIYRNRK